MEYIRCPRCKNDVPVTYLFCPYCGYDLRFLIRERLAARLTFRDKLFRLYFLFRNPLIAIKHIATAPDFTGSFIAIFLAIFTMFLKSIVVLFKEASGISFYAVIYLFLLALMLEIILVTILTLIIHIAISIVGGKGLIKDIFCMIGYSQAYFAVAHLISLILVVSAPITGDETALIASVSPSTFLYVIVLILTGIVVGYGISFTHLLKKITAIGATLSAVLILILFFYVL